MSQTDRYLPALWHKRLTPMYDPLLKWVMRESTFKRQLIAQANIADGHRVLDLGCGTATLTILVKQTHSGTEVVGLDGDPQVLEIGRAKAARMGVSIVLDQGLAQALPYPDQSFHRVVSSLMFHHLTNANKRRALSEVYRVLKPGGELHIVDFGKPNNPLASFIAVFTQKLEEADANIKGLLPEMMSRAGFVEVEEPARFMTLFGVLSTYTARKSRP